jgi:hypothetical protein
MRTRDLDRVSLARDLTGIWKNRKDLKDMDAAVRKLRKGSRLKRCRIG